MDQTAEDQLYDAVSRNDINNVKKNLRKDVNINTICSSGLTPLGAAAHLGNVTICETLIENYKRSIKDDEFSNHRHKKLCIDFSNDRQCRINDHKNVGFFVVNKDLDSTESETIEIGDGPTPEGMDALEWDTEIKETDESPTDSYSCLYKWYADILNRTSDLLKTPLHCDINQIDRYGRTALHYGCDRGHLPIVQLLISAGCNVNHTSSDNISCLHLASSQGYSEIVKLLLQAGARVNHITNTKTTALHFASSQGHIKIMHILLQAGAHVDALDSADRSPLGRAAAQLQPKAVELLVRHGARINIEDVNGYTPLCEAVWVNSLPIVQTLISAGAKVTQSHFLLHYSVLNNHLDITKLLVTAGSVVNLRDDNGNTPLILAAKNGQVDTARFLIDHGAMVNLPNTVTGSTPLYEAVECLNDFEHLKFKSVLELLFSRGAGLEIQSNWDTPLFRAIFLQKTQIAITLIQFGADVNFCDPRIHVDNMCIARKNNNNRLFGTSRCCKIIFQNDRVLNILSILTTLFILWYRYALQFNAHIVFQARIAMMLISVIGFLSYVKYKEIFKTLTVVWMLWMSLLMRPYNVILITICFGASQILSGLLVYCKNKLLFLHLWLAYALFHCQGLSNSLSSIDISAGYVGLTEYSLFLTSFQVICHTYTFHVLSILLLFFCQM